jgi:hypothetical protein
MGILSLGGEPIEPLAAEPGSPVEPAGSTFG